MSNPSNTVLVRSVTSIRVADLLPSNIKRASRVHALLDAFGLTNKLSVVEPDPSTVAELTTFHSEELIEYMCPHIASASASSDYDSDDGEDAFGLLYDCPVFDGLEGYVRYTAGGTIAASKCLALGHATVAIHWEGGRHHCQRDRVAGFCYVNDIVLGILELQEQFSKVLYIDLDLHHGDGVQDAFQYSNQVMTLSIHHYARGFYPNTGNSVDEGKGKGKGHSINLPLKQGIGDERFLSAFKSATQSAVEAFDPQAVVVQCGCDGLANDKHKIFNLTADAYVSAIRHIQQWELPMLLLGGGGYNTPDCARCWARITAVASGQPDIDPGADIPDHQYLNEYAPSFDMATDASLVADENTNELVNKSLRAIENALSKI